MTRAKAYQICHVKASQRRRLPAHERLERDRRQAQHSAKVVEQALHDLGLPENLVAELEGRLRSQQKLLGKICGVMFPSLFGCRTNAELCRVRGWDKNLPAQLLSALPKRSWIKRLRRLGLEVLVPLWRHVARMSAATRSRWQWSWTGCVLTTPRPLPHRWHDGLAAPLCRPVGKSSGVACAISCRMIWAFDAPHCWTSCRSLHSASASKRSMKRRP
jgi:hypothetical protein